MNTPIDILHLVLTLSSSSSTEKKYKETLKTMTNDLSCSEYHKTNIKGIIDNAKEPMELVFNLISYKLKYNL